MGYNLEGPKLAGAYDRFMARWMLGIRKKGLKRLENLDFWKICCSTAEEEEKVASFCDGDA